jgi:tetratricopeptide (TPR) repeat protein
MLLPQPRTGLLCGCLALLLTMLAPAPSRAQEPEVLPPELDLLDAKLQRAKAQARFEVEQRATTADRGWWLRRDARRTLELLAVEYFADEQYRESITTYKLLQALYPDDTMVCAWQAKIVVSTLASDDVQLQWRESDKLDQRNCDWETHSLMLNMAKTWAARATRGQRPFEALAMQAYERYLSRFPSGPDHYPMQHAHAELLQTLAMNAAARGDLERARELFGAAHEAFVRVLELDPEGEFTLAAASAQLLAIKGYLEPAIEYSTDAERLLWAHDIYLKFVKDTAVAELPGVLRQRAQLALEHHRFAEAERDLVQLIEQFAEVDHARDHVIWSATVLFDVLSVRFTRRENTPLETMTAGDAIVAWFTKLEAMEFWNQPELEPLRVRASNLLGGVVWKQAMWHAYEGEYGECADAFLALYDRIPSHPRASTQLWNAADCLDADSQGGRAVEVREALLLRHPDSEHVPGTMFYLAEGYGALARHEDSAATYEAFAASYPDHEQADDALENAYRLRLGLGQREQAQADLATFERLYRRKDVQRAAGLFWAQHDLLSPQ